MNCNGLELSKLDEFTRAYIECALWSSSDTDSTGKEFNLDAMGVDYLAPETWGTMVADCQRFQVENSALLKSAYALYKLPPDGETTPQDMAGHDFWLTRCGHGAGFWDRGLGDIGERLTALCGWRTEWPEQNLYIGDDGAIHIGG